MFWYIESAIKTARMSASDKRRWCEVVVRVRKCQSPKDACLGREAAASCYGAAQARPSWTASWHQLLRAGISRQRQVQRKGCCACLCGSHQPLSSLHCSTVAGGLLRRLAIERVPDDYTGEEVWSPDPWVSCDIDRLTWVSWRLGLYSLPKASWLALCEAAASQVAENRGATASVALLQVSMGHSLNLHSASSALQGNPDIHTPPRPLDPHLALPHHVFCAKQNCRTHRTALLGLLRHASSVCFGKYCSSARRWHHRTTPAAC